MDADGVRAQDAFTTLPADCAPVAVALPLGVLAPGGTVEPWFRINMGSLMD